MNRKTISQKGYRVLAVMWTLASAAMAVAVVRRLPGLSVPTLGLLAASVLAAAYFWKCWHRAGEVNAGPWTTAPKFADNPVLFDDDPPKPKNSEEKNHER